MTSDPDPRKLDVLIIEDNPDDAFLVSSVISKTYLGAKFVTAANRREFDDAINSAQQFDIILSDWSLPHFSGMEALAKVKAAGIMAPFIIVSGKIGEEAAIDAIRQGAYDYILKENLSRLPTAIGHALRQREGEEQVRRDQARITLQARALEMAPVAIVLLGKDKTVEFVNPAFEKLTGFTVSEVTGKDISTFCLNSACMNLPMLPEGERENQETSLTVIERKKDGTFYFEDRKLYPVTDVDGQTNHFILIKQNITTTEQAREELAVQIGFDAAIRQARTPEALCNATVSFIKEQSEMIHVGIGLYTNGLVNEEKWYGEKVADVRPGGDAFVREIALAEEKIGKLVLLTDMQGPYDMGKLFNTEASQFEMALSRLIVQQRTTAQMRHLSFLKLISRTISTIMDFDEVMKPLLVQTKSMLNGDAVTLYLFDKQHNTFVSRVSEGFNTALIHNAVVPMGQPNVGVAAEKQQITIATSFKDVDPDTKFGKLIEKEGFLSQYCVPIIIGGKPFGVLEIFQRKAFAATPEWLNLFDAIATQMGLALDYNNLYNELQKAYLELEHSYEATLEGWSAAMDVRDHETEGHSQRVASLALALAKKLGLSKGEIENIRRGALLHDIGKLGVPDSILLKNGPLTEEEWRVMRRHPKLAYDFLSKVPYLQKSLDIPRYHHEKWDGTGYPSGLNGEQIPLAARLFTVIDVYDALTSDRPYRKAWPESQAKAYLREHAGSQFDPAIVGVFLTMIE